MNIENIRITSKRNGELWSDYNGAWHKIKDHNECIILRHLLHVYKCKTKRSERLTTFTSLMTRLIELNEAMATTTKVDSDVSCDISEVTCDISNESEATVISQDDIVKVESVMQSLINFFCEFAFEPNFRFVNTLYNCVASGKNAKEYVSNYFTLTDSQYALSILEKMKSQEFTSILTSLKTLPTNGSKVINHRLKLYYGSQGTGKTTQAISESDNLCMVCHSAMLPSDLMEDFKFEDGKPNFKPSSLQNAMTTGKVIVLDEINLLPFESLRFLQSIVDGKKEFTYKGEVIKIHDRFQIIGTMNLTVNGNVFSLPEPLVDRACEIRKYTLTAKQLVNAIL